MPERLAPERLAIVTGTSSGIGEALAASLLADGWTVLGISRRSVSIQSTAYQHICFDLAEVDLISTDLEPRLVEVLRSRTWATVALVNNAAVLGQLKNIDALSAGATLTSLAVNTVAPIALMGLVVRFCPPEAVLRIVNISSGLASRPLAGCVDYCSGKAALQMAGMVFAAENTSSDIGVLSYAPGIVKTAMQDELRTQSKEYFPSSWIFKQFHNEGKLVPANCVLQPIEAFLASKNPPAFSEARFEAPAKDS